MLERIFLPRTETIDQLRLSVEKVINGIIARYNREENTMLGVLDANQHRIINLGRPVRGSDAVPLSYLREILNKRPESKLIQLAEGGVTVGLHSARPTSGELGELFYETDREVMYVFDGSDWRVVGGVMNGTLSPNEKPADLGASDVGFLFFSTDFFHQYRWDGSAWELAIPGDAPGMIGMFVVSPGDGWKLLDGTGNPITISTPSGGTTTVSVDALNSGDTFPRFGGFTGTVDTAVLPTGVTGDTDPGGSVSLGTATVQSGAGSTVAGNTGTTSVVGGTHNHDYSGMTDPGRPESIALLPYLRL